LKNPADVLCPYIIVVIELYCTIKTTKNNIDKKIIIMAKTTNKI